MKSLPLSSNAVSTLPRTFLLCSRKANPFYHLRYYHDDGRQRVSGFWIPTGGIGASKPLLELTEHEDSHSLLVKAGFIRQAHAGIFQYLPLGLRVQDKIAQLVDKHMAKLGASKLSLSTFSSEELWQRTGRLNSNDSELFRLMDRRGGKFLLSPTHEEEITSLVGSVVISYKELPLRLYQITRKYRDEPRPRQGLLRTREFLMKDLYTFDATQSEATQTYKRVRESYDAFFNEFKIPFLTAEAASGEMGGDVSHEYHMKTSKGEDDIVICNSCNYAANEELAQSCSMLSISDRGNADESTGSATSDTISPSNDFQTQINHNSLQWVGISRDCGTLVQAFIPKIIEISAGGEKHVRKTKFNFHAIKRRFPDINLGVEDPIATFEKHQQLKHQPGYAKAEISTKPQLLRLFDIRYPTILEDKKVVSIDGLKVPFLPEPGKSIDQLDLVKIEAGDPCPKCASGTLTIESAVELGHTFLLGTRYSAPLEATVKTKNAPHSVPMQMGCHGIGISRLIAAVADVLADEKGLNWPRIIAPFEAVIVPTEGNESGGEEVYDALTATGDPTAGEAIDTLLDDRARRLGWKLRDADMIGYPVVIVVGKYWAQARRSCEVQCRRLDSKRIVPLDELRSFVQAQLKLL